MKQTSTDDHFDHVLGLASDEDRAKAPRCPHGKPIGFVACVACFDEKTRELEVRHARRRALRNVVIILVLVGLIAYYVSALIQWQDMPRYRILVRNEGDAKRYVIQERIVLIPGQYLFRWNHTHFSLEDAQADVTRMVTEEERIERINNLKWEVVKP